MSMVKNSSTAVVISLNAIGNVAITNIVFQKYSESHIQMKWKGSGTKVP